MKLFAVAFICFLLGFAGLATGLLLRRKGLRGSCSSAPGAEHDCTCKSTVKPVMKITVVNRPTTEDSPLPPES